jgi:hypothetical protein
MIRLIEWAITQPTKWETSNIDEKIVVVWEEGMGLEVIANADGGIFACAPF